MRKSFAWMTIGLVTVLAAGGWLMSGVDEPESPGDMAQAGNPIDAVVSGNYQKLKGRITSLEASETVSAAQYAELVEKAAALEEQVRMLSDALTAMAAERSNSGEDEFALEFLGQADDSGSSINSSSSLYGDLQPAPTNLARVQGAPGYVFVYQVTGSKNGPVWGTDIYTDDSSIAVAAVHAGLLQPGETGAILLTILPGLDEYPGSSRYEVNSNNFGEWPRSYGLQRLY